MHRLLISALLLFSAAGASAQQPVERVAERTARLQATVDADSGRIVLIQPDSERGVWALTRNGKLYHCQRRGQDGQTQIHCIGKEGEVRADY